MMERIKNWITRHPYDALFILVILAGAVLRLYDFSCWSLSNDELSALNRLRSDSFSELIQNGVRPDGHPAFTQVFLYYWTAIFGLQPFWVRLPFVLAGIASIWLVYAIGKQWFNAATGLYASLFIAVLPFTILYSQLARPYSFGLLFTLLTAYFWGRYFLLHHYGWGTLAGFALSAAFAMYTHYFSFMMAGLFILAGFLFISRDNWKGFVISIATIFLLYLPYLNIFLFQLSLGGVGGAQGWLTKPKWDWIFNFFYYAFGLSAFHLLLLLAFLTIFMVWYVKNTHIRKIQWVLLAIFLLPYLIGFVYSILVNPVLQYSGLLFAFPFLLLFLFSFFDDDRPVVSSIFVLVGLIGGSWVALDKTDDFRNSQFADFKACTSVYMEWENKYRKDSITLTASINHPYYLEYYFHNAHKNPPQIIVLESKQGRELADLVQILEQSRTPYFAYFRLKPAPIEIPDVIAGTYPVLLDYRDYFGQAEAFLFAKDTSLKGIPKPKPISNFYCDFEGDDELFGVRISNLDTICCSGKYAMHLRPEMEWGPGIKITTRQAELRSPSRVRIKVEVLTDSTLIDSPIVLTLTDQFDKQYIWLSGKLENFLTPGKWGTAYFTADLPHPYSLGDELKIFIWNKDHRNLWVDNFSIEFYKLEK